MSESFQVRAWRDDLRRAHQSDWKAPIYAVLRPLLNRQARRALKPETLARLHPDLVLFKRGMPSIARRRWGAGGSSLAGKTIVVQGCGNGWDVASWARLKPRRIIGVDLFAFDSWPDVRRALDVEVEFHAAPLSELSFIADGSVDMVASDAVYEHVQNMDAVLRETTRILRSGGTVYATYGPLWFSPGGDHFSGRGGSEHIFNHVLLNPDEYQRYFQTHRQPNEDFQSGGRYVEIDLFSKLRTDEYLTAFRQSGLTVESLVIELSPEALEFKAQHPREFETLLRKHPACSHDDFLMAANYVRLRKT